VRSLISLKSAHSAGDFSAPAGISDVKN
jgi:hypothetical protein